MQLKQGSNVPNAAKSPLILDIIGVKLFSFRVNHHLNWVRCTNKETETTKHVSIVNSGGKLTRVSSFLNIGLAKNMEKTSLVTYRGTDTHPCLTH